MRLNSQTWRTYRLKLFLERRGTWRAGCVERCLSGSGGGGWRSRCKPTPGLLPHRLQQLLMRSRSARLLAVRRVTQDNQGKKTAGVDGVKSLTPPARLALAEAIHPTHQRKRKAKPVRRVWIPKPGKPEKRPLGIPVMFDRACQARGLASPGTRMPLFPGDLGNVSWCCLAGWGAFLHPAATLPQTAISVPETAVSSGVERACARSR